MPLSLGTLACGVQDEAGLDDLAQRCSYRQTRQIGTFRKLGYEEILSIYRAANH